MFFSPFFSFYRASRVILKVCPEFRILTLQGENLHMIILWKGRQHNLMPFFAFLYLDTHSEATHQLKHS